MSFEKEWRQARTDATENRAVATRLNQTGGGGATPNLAVNSDALGPIGADAHALYEGVKRDTETVRVSNYEAAAALTTGQFTCGAQLMQVHERWYTQVGTLRDACAQISNHLDYSVAAHAKDDAEIRGDLMAVSKINGLLK
ncbi:hypothetical protein DEJ50_33005 [Streptomyces venezuelae]|uniref:AG1 protein n=1 Tax=Streptomyces venezuelae TaxID=54571 RepID=A0A5P2DFC6_STRVZ|nr:hypothetical protein [Streptomyces venezuelae]QES51941.1 hypothetical protein DEJ50_33005 [Streptomyces venezuelae]